MDAAILIRNGVVQSPVDRNTGAGDFQLDGGVAKRRQDFAGDRYKTPVVLPAKLAQGDAFRRKLDRAAEILNALREKVTRCVTSPCGGNQPVNLDLFVNAGPLPGGYFQINRPVRVI